LEELCNAIEKLKARCLQSSPKISKHAGSYQGVALATPPGVEKNWGLQPLKEL